MRCMAIANSAWLREWMTISVSQYVQKICAPRSAGVAGRDTSSVRPDANLIDLQVLERIQADLGDGDPTIVIELIDMFLSDSLQLLATMRQSLAECAAEDLQRAAHTLKSSSATLGAAALSKLSCTPGRARYLRRGVMLLARPNPRRSQQ